MHLNIYCSSLFCYFVPEIVYLSASVQGKAGSSHLPYKYDNSMKLVKTLLFFLSVTALTSLQAQDIHYTLFNMSPLTLNPANTGAFLGTVRVGGIYRGQWWSVSPNRGYNTPGAYADAPIIRGFRDQDWVGVGTTIYQDRSGHLALTTNMSFLSGAYHFGLDKAGKSVITLGVQWGRVERGLNSENVLLGSNYDPSTGTINDFMAGDDDAINTGGGGGMPDDPNNPNPNPQPPPQQGNQNRRNMTDVNRSYLDIRAGLLYKNKINDFDNLEVGLSFGRMNAPAYLFETGDQSGPGFFNQIFNPNRNTPADELGGVGAKRPLLMTAHARYEWAINELWSAAPTAMFQTTGGANEINLQAWAGYNIKPEDQIKLHFGLGYRASDAAQVLAGLDYKDLRVAMAFDVNLSPYRVATNFQGAFEIAAWYIIKIYKEPKVKPAILCPKF